jgi:hypothetical protein
MVDALGAYFDGYDDEAYHRLTHGLTSEPIGQEATP